MPPSVPDAGRRRQVSSPRPPRLAGFPAIPDPGRRITGRGRCPFTRSRPPPRCPMSAPATEAAPLPVGLAILLTHDAPGRWRGELRDDRLVLVRTAPAPVSAVVALLEAYQEEAPP